MAHPTPDMRPILNQTGGAVDAYQCERGRKIVSLTFNQDQAKRGSYELDLAAGALAINTGFAQVIWIKAMTFANRRYAAIRNLAQLIAHVHATSCARVVTWNERSSKRAEQRLNWIGQAFGNLLQRTNKSGGRPSR